MDVFNLPYVDLLIGFRACHETLLVISHGHCIHWVVVLVKGRDQGSLGTEWWGTGRLFILQFSLVALSDLDTDCLAGGLVIKLID
jgi:hypothetical protein